MKKELKEGIGVFTTSTSGRAFESIEIYEDDPSIKMALLVCRVIAGRVHKPLDNFQELAGQSGFDSLAGKVGLYANIEELYLLNPRALLPCFVVICKSWRNLPFLYWVTNLSLVCSAFHSFSCSVTEFVEYRYLGLHISCCQIVQWPYMFSSMKLIWHQNRLPLSQNCFSFPSTSTLNDICLGVSKFEYLPRIPCISFLDWCGRIILHLRERLLPSSSNNIYAVGGQDRLTLWFRNNSCPCPLCSKNYNFFTNEHIDFLLLNKYVNKNHKPYFIYFGWIYESLPCH